MSSIGSPSLYLVFFTVVGIMLAIDMLALKRSNNDKPPSLKQSAAWSALWVSVAVAFGGGLWAWLNHTVGPAIAGQKTMEYFTGYLIEKSLAVDNVFVWIMIFTAFAVPAALQRRILLYGVIGAILMRSVMIFAGAWLLEQFHWILYVFGGFLVYTGIKMWVSHSGDEEKDIEQGWMMRFLRKTLPITPTPRGEKFLVRENGKLWLTPLALVLVMVELSDVVFAVDSIPAIFAVTTDPFIVLTANLMAILGLRAMFFLVADLANRLYLLPYALSIILVFIGTKMLLLEVYKIPISVSLGFISATLLIAGVLSWYGSRKKENQLNAAINDINAEKATEEIEAAKIEQTVQQQELLETKSNQLAVDQLEADILHNQVPRAEHASTNDKK